VPASGRREYRTPSRHARCVVAAEIAAQERDGEDDAEQYRHQRAKSLRRDLRRYPGPKRRARKRADGRGEDEAAIHADMKQIAAGRAQGAGEPRELARAEQRRVRRLREGGKESRKLDESAAAGHRIDQAGAKRGGQHDDVLGTHRLRVRRVIIDPDPIA